MEFGRIVQFLENKTVVVTGATGFLAKIFVEKILRVQPNVKKLYLLLRAADAKSASLRLQNEVIGKDLFRLLKEKYGANLSSFISEKTVLVPGDITHSDELGVKDSNLREAMQKELDVIVNLAATTNFDERYDVALGINTIGAKNVLCFAKKCNKLKVLVHISTAYVCGEKPGLILETPYHIGDTLNGASGLDIDKEKELVEEKLNELRAIGATYAEMKEAMKDMGIKRANVYGWPNTYVFTKAMGEMVVEQLKDNLSLVIIRPTIVTSTYKEPFPGWVEGVRTIDSLAVAYGKGRLKCFIPQELLTSSKTMRAYEQRTDNTSVDERSARSSTTIDIIPADMVVNAIITAIVAHANKPTSDHPIYQVGSSVRNPVRYSDLQDFGLGYFTKNPWIGKDGKPVKVGKVKVLGSMSSFRRYIAIRYLLLLKGLEFANTAFCHYFDGMYSDLNRKIKFVMRLVELYRPYLFFRGVFDDMNTENLRMAARDNCAEIEVFYFDPKSIDWADYFMNVHIPGVVKYVFK